MKKFGISLMVTTLLMGSFMAGSFAEDIKTYSLYDMEKLLIENNLDYIKVKESFSKEERDLKDANTQRDGIMTYDYKKEPYDNYDVEIKKNLNPIKAESEYLNAKFELLKEEASLKRELKDKYIGLIYEQDLLKTMNEEFSLMKKIYSSKEKELELGTISQLQYDEFTKTYKTSHKELLAQTNLVAKSKREIAIMVGLPVGEVFDVSRVGYSAWDYDSKTAQEYVEQTEKESYQVEKLELDKLIAEKELSYKHRFAGFSDAKKEMEDLNDKIEDLPRQIANAQNTLEYDILTKYNNVIIEEENLAIAEIDLNQAVREHKANKVKYEQGLITEIDYFKSSQTLTKAQNQYDTAKLKYNGTVEEFRDYINLNTMTYRLETE